MSNFWNWYIIILTVANIAGIVWLLFANSRKRADDKAASDTTGHIWDEDLSELNHPLPRWWFGLFVASVIFAIVYLALYPGMGNFAGSLGWTSGNEAARETADLNAKLESLYAQFRNRPLAELAHDPAAVKVGRNVFANNCAACHGSDARGAKGYPNLVDNDWLYGGDPDTVLASVLKGRHGVMPPWGTVLGDKGVEEVANYVRTLSGQQADATLAAAGKARFATTCVACHGPEGKGNPALGAPNLTDDIWLYGGDLATIRETIRNGRNGTMPAWESILGADRARLAAAWVLAQGAAAQTAETAAGAK